MNLVEIRIHVEKLKGRCRSYWKVSGLVLVLDRCNVNIPESPLDAVHIICLPILFGDVLLAHRHAGPVDPHDGDGIDVVLIKLDLQRAVVARGPLLQPPALDDLFGRVQFEILADNVAAEQLELATLACTLKQLWRGSCERRQPLRVGEGLVQLIGGGAKLLRVGDGGSVDDSTAAGVASGRGGLGLRCVLLGVQLGGRKFAGGIGIGSVLDVLAVLGDEDRC